MCHPNGGKRQDRTTSIRWLGAALKKRVSQHLTTYQRSVGLWATNTLALRRGDGATDGHYTLMSGSDNSCAECGDWRGSVGGHALTILCIVRQGNRYQKYIDTSASDTYLKRPSAMRSTGVSYIRLTSPDDEEPGWARLNNEGIPSDNRV